ncbi:MAG: DUF2851 family protein [Janthinobacterium lividum]
MFFTENLLHYIWKFRLYNSSNLCTTDGATLRVLAPGMQHHHAGPDFLNAKLQIGETLWAGNVEIHIRASDWMRHEHSKDQAYHNVVLHVVYKNDLEILDKNGTAIPVFVLENRIADELLHRYQNLMYADPVAFPCEKLIKRVDGLTLQNWFDRMLVQRLEEKSTQILQTVALLKGNWEEAFYQLLAANFGFKVNTLPFELLAKSLPLQILTKNSFNLIQTEALIFGQAGFLDDEIDDLHFLTLQKEYRYLKQKYNLISLEKHLWKFMRLRPLNFPTIRLAQFAALMHRTNRFLAEIIKTDDVAKINALFTGINPSSYWLDHYQFGKLSKPSSKILGQSSVENILINTVSVFLFAYGTANQLETHICKAIKILETLPCENNFIISSFIIAGIKIKSAGNSQAVIELKNNYCDRKRCLECGIGNKLLKQS